MSGYAGHNRPTPAGGYQPIQRSDASQFRDMDPLFATYEHLQGLSRGDSALTMLRQVASQVKPIMRKRGWKVSILAEFLPPEPNLLGLNINRGYKICVRLRYHHNPDLFLPIEQVVDTTLHELSHIIWGEHDSRFHALWDELRDEYETLIIKGFTGEGFLSQGHRLGGSRGANDVPPPHEMRRLARASAERRKAQGGLSTGSVQRLGGTPLHQQGRDVRQVIVDQITRRNTINKGCASGRKDATALSETSSQNTFKTKAEEDDANNRAIAQALFELMEQEEERKLGGTYQSPSDDGGLAWHPKHGLYNPAIARSNSLQEILSPLSEDEQMKFALQASMAQDDTSEHAVSPLTPDRTRSAPPATIPSQRPIPVDSFGPTHRHVHPVTGRPLSRLVREDDDRRQAILRKSVPRPQASNSGMSSNALLPSPTFAGPATTRSTATGPSPNIPVIDLSEPFNPDEWTCAVCTCNNPVQFLACDACGGERPHQLSNYNSCMY